MNKSFKYRLYPTKEQEEKLLWTLERCRELYNAALIERRDSYNFHVRQHPNYYDAETRKQLTKELTVNYYQQKGDLPEIKSELRPEYQDIHSQVLQDVLLRLKKAFDGFFRRVKQGEEPGYPRLKGKGRYDSFTYPQAGGFSITHDNRVYLSKIGSLKVTFHRDLEGTPKTCTMKQESGQWYVIFSCEVEQPEPLPAVASEVGIDLGVTYFAALSDETFIESPRYLRKGQADVQRTQRKLARCKRGSHRRKKAVRHVAKAHRKIANQRKDFHHKQARKLVREHQVIVFEELQLTNLTKKAKPKQDENGQYLPNGASAKSGLTKSILDNGLGQFVQIVMNKAEEAGRHVYKINPKYTSQICSACGIKGPKKDLSERVHTCIACGVVLDRDTNAAKNILLAWKEPTYWLTVCGAASRCVEAPYL